MTNSIFTIHTVVIIFKLFVGMFVNVTAYSLIERARGFWPALFFSRLASKTQQSQKRAYYRQRKTNVCACM
jgi:hypothetical protein